MHSLNHNSFFNYLLGVLISALFFCGIFPQAQAQNCPIDQDLLIAVFDWPSSQVNTEVTRIILEEGFDCSTEIVSGSVIPLLQALKQGQIDLSVEVWMNTVPDNYFGKSKKDSVIDLGINMHAIQGFFMPSYMKQAKQPNTIEQVRTEFNDLKQSEEIVFHNCVEGWQCELINDFKLKAYGLEDSLVNSKFDSGVALEKAITEALNAQESILVYYWGPTWILGEYDLIRVVEPSFDKENWKAMLKYLDSGEYSDFPEAVAYPDVEIRKAVSSQAFEKLPEDVISFLEAYTIEQALMSEYLALMKRENLTAEVLAERFLVEQTSLWTPWLPQAIANQIMDTLE